MKRSRFSEEQLIAILKEAEGEPVVRHETHTPVSTELSSDVQVLDLNQLQTDAQLPGTRQPLDILQVNPFVEINLTDMPAQRSEPWIVVDASTKSNAFSG